MQGQGGIDKVLTELLDRGKELVAGVLDVVAQDCVVDCEKGLLVGEDDRKGGKVPLEPGVDGEAAGGGVHGGHVLCVVDLLEAELVPAVPVAVVDVLPDDGVGSHRAVLVHLGHVHVVQEVDELLAAGRTVVLTGLLLQRLLNDLLGHLGAVVEVEGDIGHSVLLVQVAESLIEHESLARAGQPYEHEGELAVHQHVDEILHPDRLGIVDETGG